MPERSSHEIRASMEANRLELGQSIERLKAEVAVATDWRVQISRNRTKAFVGAAVAGFVLGGGIAAVGGLFRRRH